MEIRLDQVRLEPFRWQETQAIAAEALERPELLDLGQIDWRGTVVHAPPAFLLRAETAYEQTLACMRCLAPIVQPVASSVELMIYVDPSEPAPGEHELEEGDLGVLTVREEVLDTQPILLEQLQLNVPMRALCRQGCAGLCPVCGGDRNLKPCDCEERSSDPRWAVLAELRNRFER